MIDMNVYSRNQSFRILNSCKFGKNTPMLVSQLTTSTSSDDEVFLQSLICDKKLSVNVDIKLFDDIKCPLSVSKDIKKQNVNTSIEFDCPEIDDFISSLVQNGQITKKTYYENSCTKKPMIIYEISGFRYCSNVKRKHKEGI